MRSALRGSIAVAAVGALAWLSVEAATLGEAGDVAFESQGALEQLAIVGAPGDSPQYSRLAEDLRRASSISERSPMLHEQMGVVAARQGGSHLGEADGHFRSAMQLRPVSAYTWADFAAQRYRTGNTDEQFQAAMSTAALLGPNEPAVQATVSDFGLAMWGEETATQREMVERMLERGMRRDPGRFLQIAQRRGRLDVACRHFDRPTRQVASKWVQTCQSMEATS